MIVAILYQTDDSTIIDCFIEARALMESVSAFIPAAVLENLPRPETETRFKYRDDGEIESVFLRVLGDVKK